jgi:EAL domain-containing protein (putative c-di-GMP-specific phosphodiesterase class I)
MFERRGFIAWIVAIAAIGFHFASRNAEAAQSPVPGNALALAGIAVALIAIVVAIYAVRRAEAVRGDFQRFSRSVEMALNEVASRSSRDSATIGELNRMVADEIRGMADRRGAGNETPDQRTDADAPARRPRPVRVETRQTTEAAASGEAFDQALAEAVSGNALQISLQPIISVSRSAAVGFEVHAHVTAGDEQQTRDFRRLARPVTGLDQAVFEQALLREAIETGRRQLGSDSEKMPFHIAISEALLSNEIEMQNLAELTSRHRALAKSVVLSIAAAEFELHGSGRDNLDKLTMEGFRLAVEDWEGGANEAKAASQRGVAFVKIAADRLLGRQRSRRSGVSAHDMVEALHEAGIGIIATGVARDEDAVSLIDLGIDLMEGDRFSGPRLIKAPASRRAAMAET